MHAVLVQKDKYRLIWHNKKTTYIITMFAENAFFRSYAYRYIIIVGGYICTQVPIRPIDNSKLCGINYSWVYALIVILIQVMISCKKVMK